MIEGLKRVAFFGAHTDDEFICAGTLHRLARAGCDVHVVTFMPAATQDDRRGGVNSLAVVREEWEASLRRIGARGKLYGWMPSADAVTKRPDEVGQAVYDYVVDTEPEACFILSPEDENTAHRVLGQQCERVMRGRYGLRHVLRCQYPWNYGVGRANVFVALDEEDLKAKRDVINCYQSQLWRYGYEDMLVAQCRVDGLSVKVPYAERFELLRGVV